MQVNEENIWPSISELKPTTCAALFVDIRSSSAMSVGTEAAAVTLRIQAFLEVAKNVWDDLKGPKPNLVRSYGDGLFIVWELLDSGEPLTSPLGREVLDKVIQFNLDLPAALGNRWGTGGAVSLGMGLVSGHAFVAKLSQGRDYYGYAINLAAKLQSFARPFGLVIESQFHRDLREDVVRQKYGLHPRQYTLPVSNHPISALSTIDVCHNHGWTCLAWPGFASPLGKSHSILSLNLQGVNILEHEGVQGNIGSLKVWSPDAESLEPGDLFEIIIDDFDNLQDLHESSSVRFTMTLRENYSNIILPLRNQVRKSGFSFYPIRFGVNSIAYNKSKQNLIENCQTYQDFIELSGQISIGIYNNLGMSFPLLLAASNPENCNVFDSCGKGSCQELLKFLSYVRKEKCQGKPLFRLYNSISRLAADLEEGDQIQAVLGGGAWLISQQLASSETMLTSCPKNAFVKGFIWIEGAAILERAYRHREAIRNFLLEKVMANDFQDALVDGVPYGAAPVNQTAFERLLNPNNVRTLISTYSRKTISQELRSIMSDDGEKFSEGFFVRRRSQHISTWIHFWRRIRKEYCITVTG